MAKKEDIAIDVKIRAADAANTAKDLKKALKELKDELNNVEAGSDEFRKLSKAINDTEGKLGDLNDTFNTLTGSGIERTNSSLSLLKEGFSNFDFEKIGIAFKGLGTAMKAVPVLLLVEGIQYLIEKFGIIQLIMEGVEKVFYAITDAMGITNKAAEEKTKTILAGLEKEQKALTERYDAEIKLAQAAGKSTASIEIEKLKAVEDSIQKQFNTLQDLAIKKKKLNEDEQKQYEELQSNLLKASTDRMAKEVEEENKRLKRMDENRKAFSDTIKNINKELELAGMSDRERELNDIKQKTAEKLKELDRVSAKGIDSEREYVAAVKAKNDILKEEQRQLNLVYDKYNKEHYDKLKADAEKHYADLRAEEKELDDYRRQVQKDWEKEQARVREDFRNSRFKETEEEKVFQGDVSNSAIKNANDSLEANKKAEEGKRAEFEKTMAATKQGLQAAQALTDLYFAHQLRQAKGNADKEKEIRKKQFNVNKAFGVANAVIDGVGAVQKALNNPYPLNIVLAVLSGVLAAANVAKIASAKFDDGGGSSADAGGGSLGSAPAPVVPTPNNTVTKIDDNGTVNNANVGPQKIFVVESDITEKQKRVATIEESSKIG
jgi:hypothetical protein